MPENTRVAVISIVVENPECVTAINGPYREKNISIISVVIDAEPDVINRVSGKLGRIDGATVKTACSKK